MSLSDDPVNCIGHYGSHAAWRECTNATGRSTGTQLLKPAERDQLPAPIALYPDTLLAEVLMAPACPLDIVQAERWIQANKNLTGDQLKPEVGKQPWG